MLIVDKNKYVGYAVCVPFCPNDALQPRGIAGVKREDCNNCMQCFDYCPVDALEVKE